MSLQSFLSPDLIQDLGGQGGEGKRNGGWVLGGQAQWWVAWSAEIAGQLKALLGHLGSGLCLGVKTAYLHIFEGARKKEKESKLEGGDGGRWIELGSRWGWLWDCPHMSCHVFCKCILYFVFCICVTQGGDGWAVEEREGRGRCLVATRQLEVRIKPNRAF